MNRQTGPERPQMHHLPRLSPEFYRGFAAVFWPMFLKFHTEQREPTPRNASGSNDDL